MKLSILTSLLAVASVNQLALADDKHKKGLRGDANRDLGILDWFKNRQDGDKPVQLPIFEDSNFPNLEDMDLEDLDLTKIMEGMENFREMLENMKPLLELLPAIIQNMDMVESLLPMLGGLMDAESGCKTTLKCSACADGVFAEIMPEADCVNVQYIVANPQTGKNKQRCVPERMADFLVGGINRYECAP